MSQIEDWDVTDANNNSPAPDGWPEGMNYGDVNDVGRMMMGALKRWFKDVNGTLNATMGNDNEYAVTLNTPYAAYFNGILPLFSAIIVATSTKCLRIMNIYLDRINPQDLRPNWWFRSLDHYYHRDAR